VIAIGLINKIADRGIAVPNCSNKEGLVSMTIYLYIKTHQITGLKNLGQTSSKNPDKYLGSGLYWKAHLKVHGIEHTTEILRECIDKEDLKFWGLHFSNLWNVVESNEWANLKIEQGDGGRQSEEVRRIISQKGKGRIPWNKGKAGYKNKRRIVK